MSPGRAGQSNPSNTTPTGTWKQGDTFGRVSLQETGTGTEPHVGEQLLCTLPLLSTPGDSRTRDTQLMSSSWDIFPDVNVIQLMGLSWDILPAVHQSSAVLSMADPALGQDRGAWRPPQLTCRALLHITTEQRAQEQLDVPGSTAHTTPARQNSALKPKPEHSLPLLCPLPTLAPAPAHLEQQLELGLAQALKHCCWLLTGRPC